MEMGWCVAAAPAKAVVRFRLPELFRELSAKARPDCAEAATAAS